MKRINSYLFSLLLISNISFASSLDYIYPFSQPSISNYGTTGLISNPNARFLDEGTVAFAWSSLDPYLRGSFIAYPFSWFEASYQYTDINNKLYSDSFAFSGNQSYKDKGFDIKIRLKKESEYFPQLALGFRDIAGTGLFTSEYVVASKMLRNIDFTVGVGWGKLSAQNYKNIFSAITNDKSWDERVLRTDTKGGEFSTDAYFKGPMSIFGGVEYFFPNMKGLRLKAEYDGIDYSKEGFVTGITQKSKFNYSFHFPVTKHFSIKLGYVRGNTINFGFSFKANFVTPDSFVKKSDPKLRISNTDEVKEKASNNQESLYGFSLNSLRSGGFALNEANISDDGDELEITYAQNIHQDYARATGRIVSILDQISPEEIKTFKLMRLNADMAMNTITISREKFNRFRDIPIQDLLLNEETIQPVVKRDRSNYKFTPNMRFPFFDYEITPTLRTQIGGPDGFFFGDLRINLDSELIIARGTNIQLNSSAGVFDNLGDLKLASDSVLPRVRTDIVLYLKESKEFSIERLQLNKFFSLSKDVYTKVSAGYLEEMFAGFGGEVLYRPFYKSYAVGAEAWHVKQRDYDMLFNFKDYETITGHLNFYYRHEPTKILFMIKGGKFLAKDSGFNFDISRVFDSGLRMGVFFSRTDISKEEFGEGSFDKGWYFHIPIEAFYKKYRRGSSSFGLRPVTRDGAQFLMHGFDLYGVTDEGNYNSVYRTWKNIYD